MNSQVALAPLSRTFQILMVVRGALVGCIVGVLIAGYRFLLSQCEGMLRAITSQAATSPLIIPLWIAVLGLLLLLLSALMRFAPGTVGSGIPQVEADALGRLDLPWRRVIPIKVLEGGITAFAGLSLGREGPSVQLGGMCGKAVSELTRATEEERRLLVTCGAGAGMAAAFSAPLTGVMFAVEEIHKSFSAPLVIGTMASAVAAVLCTGALLGEDPLIPIRFAFDLPHIAYGLVALLGAFLGLLGALHNRGMFLGQALYGKIRSHLPLSRLAIPFGLAGLCAFAAPSLMDGGDAILEILVRVSNHPTLLLLLLLLGKYLFTNISASSGAPGGTLYPLVVMGALAGALFGRAAVAFLGLDGAYINNFMLLGIAGLFAGAVQAPVTGCLLVFELTGSFSALLSLGLVSLVAYVVANLTKTPGYYEHLLGNLLAHDSDEILKAPRRSVVTHTWYVNFGSEAEGKRLSELHCPQGSSVCLVTRCGRSLVPSQDLVLEAADGVLFVIDSALAPIAEARIEALFRPGYPHQANEIPSSSPPQEGPSHAARQSPQR